ncbi:auxilin-like clathrin-binding protein required for normal clathrin function [Paecilomyces lecythidis]
MEDLSGLSWTPSSNEAKKPPPMSSSSLFSTMRSTPLSGRSTPLSGPSGPSNPPSKPTTPASDSFANLVSFNSSNPDKNLSLAERQKRLQEERAKQEAEKRQRWEAQYGGNNAQFWDQLGQGGSSPATVGAAPSSVPPKIRSPEEDEDDILAAFKASAPVDASTNFPIPSSTSSPAPAPAATTSGFVPTPQKDNLSFLDDDDPFGLGQMSSKPAASTTTPKPTQETTDDDFLGDLAKPVSEFSSTTAQRSSSQTPVIEETKDISKPADDVDRAVAELVDMGFPADKAHQALRSTESGTDVQAAVGWLLNQAHAESREKARAREGGASPFDQRERGRDRSQRRGHDEPAWSRSSDRSDFSGTRDDRRSPATAERDAAHLAANFGNNLFKTANSLWKTGSKKFQQAVQELNADHDPSQPRWMRDASVAGERQRSSPQPRPDHLDSRRAQREAQPEVDHHPSRPEQFTDEALLLEAGEGPPSRHRTRPKTDAQPVRESHDLPLHSKNPFAHPERRAAQPSFAQQRPQATDSRTRLSRVAVEEQSTQAYISPARRRRPATEQRAPSPNVDLFESPAPSQAPRAPASATTPVQASRPSKPSTPLPTKPKAPPREIPQVSSSVLMSSHQHRQKGTEAYKRGDYAAAHEAFAAAVSGIPDKHPVTIVLLSNRAMTALKIGEPKSAIDDADTILSVIGPSKGEAESIDLGNGEPSKPMRDFYGKALMRKAEALEQLERWEEAARVWKQAVETGHGGSTSIQGRNRCEKAAGISKPAPKPASRPVQPKKPAPRPSALSDLAGPSPTVPSGEAVTRLRAANAEADRADEEKLALTDSVDAKIAAWKGGKQDNLRALLGSLDNVLWPESGWKKINMSELILPNKVKIQYMKGIAKVHPDKIPTDATIEQRMIAGAVFSTLNEAWDKFKKENNL